MSLLNTILNAIKHTDLTPVEKYADSTYHSAASSINSLLGSSGKSAYHSAASAAKSAEGYAAETLNTAGDYFTRTRTYHEPDYVRGFVSGMIGGLVGTGVKMLVDRSMPTAQPQEEHDARLQVVEGAEELVGTDINRNTEETVQQALNIAFGAIVGGIYGVIAEAAPAVQAPAGIPFGAALWTLAHKVALPALGLAPNPLKEDVGLQVGQLGSHMAYGATVEMVRRGVRNAMEQEDLL
ncbi:hypothetical protein LEM8419_02039 [Neolewinella maritima]|uniref:DUF1440 domain-containing protein n=1 Tax=Neolewinella maritima TaxID=1383882 RepID=A0ABN8F849_9BACT|nr:DUF1440 domain-containing protein [Neolewinella maritima]CAH1001096.1 hypothetical protein LEM8419_02039 [Neolewinella maritima]